MHCSLLLKAHIMFIVHTFRFVKNAQMVYMSIGLAALVWAVLGDCAEGYRYS